MFVAVLTERPAGCVRLSVTGELDLASVPAFRRELRGAMARLDPSAGGVLAVDLAGATMVDSVGLGLLIGAARRATERGAAFSVEGASESVRDLLARTGLTDLLGVQV